MGTTTVRTLLTTLGYNDQRHIAHSEPRGGGGQVQVSCFFFFFFVQSESPSDSHRSRDASAKLPHPGKGLLSRALRFDDKGKCC